MTTQSNACGCETCVGAQCTCGCQNPAAVPTASCQCGEACSCGGTCNCGESCSCNGGQHVDPALPENR